MKIAQHLGWRSDRDELIDEPAARPEAPGVSGADSGYSLVQASGLNRNEIIAAELNFAVSGVCWVQDERSRLPPPAAELAAAYLYAVYEDAIIFPVFVIVPSEPKNDRLSLRVGRQGE